MAQSNVHTGRTVHQIPCRAAMNSVEWNPKYNLLAYAGDDKNKYQADEGKLQFLATLGKSDVHQVLFVNFIYLFCFLPQVFLEYLALKAPNI